jgi:flagellar hook-length control protein FliK
VAETASNGVTGRPASSSEFQELLSQLGRSRGPGGRGDSVAQPKAATTARAASPTVDMEAAGSVEDLARIVRSQADAKRSSMTMQMTPPELGRMRVDVQMQEGGGLEVRFQAETLTGEEALRHRLDDLKSALERTGVTVDRIHVEYAPPATQSHPERDGSYYAQPEHRQWEGPNGGQPGGDGRQADNGPPGESSRAVETADGAAAGSVASLAAGVDVIA